MRFMYSASCASSGASGFLGDIRVRGLGGPDEMDRHCIGGIHSRHFSFPLGTCLQCLLEVYSEFTIQGRVGFG